MRKSSYWWGSGQYDVSRVYKTTFDTWSSVSDEEDVLLLTKKDVNLSCDECGDPGRIWEERNNLVFFYCCFSCLEESKIKPFPTDQNVKYSISIKKSVTISVLSLITALALFIISRFY